MGLNSYLYTHIYGFYHVFLTFPFSTFSRKCNGKGSEIRPQNHPEIVKIGCGTAQFRKMCDIEGDAPQKLGRHKPLPIIFDFCVDFGSQSGLQIHPTIGTKLMRTHHPDLFLSCHLFICTANPIQYNTNIKSIIVAIVVTLALSALRVS